MRFAGVWKVQRNTDDNLKIPRLWWVTAGRCPSCRREGQSKTGRSCGAWCRAKSVRERPGPNCFSHVWNIKSKINEPTKQKHTHREPTAGGKMGGGPGAGWQGKVSKMHKLAVAKSSQGCEVQPRGHSGYPNSSARVRHWTERAVIWNEYSRVCQL